MTPHLERAVLLLEQNRTELAEQELRQALAHDPDDAQAHAFLAHCLTERKALEEATAEARQAIHLAPDSPFAHFVHAQVLWDRNRPDEALLAAREAIRLDPAEADYCAREAGLLCDLKRWNEAVAAAERGLALNAEHIACANLRAMALVKLGRRSEAGEALASALAKNPDNAVTHANQGWALLEAGDPKPALQHFQEALRLDPENEWARQGVVEALKARHLIYAVVLRYFLFMSRLSSGAQWGIIVGGYFANRLLGAAAASHPTLRPWVLPFRIAYLAFVVLTWTAHPLFNLLLRLNRYGRLALTREQIVASNWIGACVGLALLSLLGALAMGWNATLGLGALVCGGLVIPMAGTFNSHAGWPRRAMAGYTGVMAGVGLGAVALRFSGVEDDGLGSTLILIFLLGMIGSSWVANFLMSRRPRL
jgi:tetratricopeptide (TPR) repeat protein